MIFIIIHYTVYVVGTLAARNAPPANGEERCVTTLKTAV